MCEIGKSLICAQRGNKRRLNVSLSLICLDFMVIGVKVRLRLGTNVHVFPDFSKTHHKKTQCGTG